MFARWRPIHKQQGALLSRVAHPSAKKYLETPLPDKNHALNDVEFLALDFETTGLDSRSEAILSMGYTRLKGMRLHMRECTHRLIRVNIPLPRESVVIHQITDDRMNTGMPMHDALHELVEVMAGKVLLVHYANIERTFLQAAMKRVYGHALPFLMVDTLALEKRRLDRLQQPIHSNQLRLANLREQYHLPRYGAHDALEDAIATAELFMAELSELGGRNPKLKLGDVLC
uniref:DNA polymerase III epsilon subunit (EC) n=1 Tax=uncultured Thiotrichaceae bacterium TaxID=298394 RepID=A0A6S6SV43_9GAMM|nr:MAG: DNA polymerase III epsilon subunit (EC [uncultured Thiotrichaceae bacterium]